MISDLQGVARIEIGESAVSPEPTDLGVLMAEPCNAFRAGGGRHAVETDLAPELPCVMANRRRLVQVLGNLIANAGRNSSETSTIRINAAAEELHVAVAVSDEGPGTPARHLPHLSRKFSKVEGEERGGKTGLGLAICRGVVEAHGGRIWAGERRAGVGGVLHIHNTSGGEGGLHITRGAGPAHRPLPKAVRWNGSGAGAGGGRRPSGIAIRQGYSFSGRVRTGGHRGPEGGAQPDGRDEDPTGDAGHRSSGPGLYAFTLRRPGTL